MARAYSYITIDTVQTISEEAIEFSQTIIYNVRFYYINSTFTEPGDYRTCKLYSNYCHTVLTYFFDENTNIFENELKDSTAYRDETDLMNLIRHRYDEWVKFPHHPTDAKYFIICAKIAMLELYVSKHNDTIEGQAEKIIARVAQMAINFGILKEDYDAARSEAKSMVASVFKWFDTDMKVFASEPENAIGWEERDLTEFEEHFLESTGRQLWSRWSTGNLQHCKLEEPFLFVLFKLYDEFVESSSNSLEVNRFVLAMVVFVVYLSRVCDFLYGAEIAIDIATRRLEEDEVFNTFRYNRKVLLHGTG